MSLKNKLNNYTKLSPIQRAKSLKWIAKQNEELILIVLEKQKDNYFKISKVDEDNKSILYLAALYMAAEEICALLQSKGKKNKAQNPHEVKNVTKLQAKQFRKHRKAEKWDKLLNLKGKIFRLRDEENFSYREIEEFLQSYHKLDVSHSYIATFYNKTKDNKNV
jgi:isopentenyldiphosphate isomerase